MTFTELKDKVISWVVLSIGKIHWSTTVTLSTEEQAKIRELLIKNYYFILTHRSNHLSSFFTEAANFFVTGKWGYWGHSLMNMEDVVKDDGDFRLIEAVGKGVVYTPFADVFDVDGVCILQPKNLTVDKWTVILDKAKTELGKPYDTLFDIANDNALSCVELCRAALMSEPNYATDFADFEALIKKYHNNLTPDMLYDLEDFEVVYEVRLPLK
jgi:hypothetical protein